MVRISNTRNMKAYPANTKRVLFVAGIALTLIIIPFTLMFFNPILALANYQLRLANGTLLHELMLQEIEGAKMYLYLFNITNADELLSGEDSILKVKEVGPFVYQEYRKNDDMELNIEPGIMRYTPNHRTELLLDESVGRPEDFFLVLPNIALLSAVQMLSKYPYFVGQFFKVLTSGMILKALPRISADKFLWGNTDPIISAVNSVVPGLIYYNSTGLMTRFYDTDARYRLTLSTSDLEKFQVKTVKRSLVNNKMKLQTMSENTFTYTNTYEGAAFPPKLTPEIPLNIYRHSMCKTLKMRYRETRQMDYGAEAFVYNIDNSTFDNRNLCDSKGWCPGGILDMSPCYFGFPFAISKGHFLDTEPKMFEKIEGLKPNRSLHETTLTVDPNIGVTMGAHMSMQLNLALGDMSLLKETRRLSDIFLPVAQVVIKHPRMREETKSTLRLMYTYGPYILRTSQVLCALLGISLLAYSAKMMYRHQVRSKTLLSNQCSTISGVPLLQ